MALSAIAKGNSNDYFTINTFGITDTNLNNKEKRNEILINASKKGIYVQPYMKVHNCIVTTLQSIKMFNIISL